MDADYEDWGEEEGGVAGPRELGNTRRKKNKKNKPNFDPAAAAEEKHKLESRLKGELFRYREVEPNDFGLTTEEVSHSPPRSVERLCCYGNLQILYSENKELNRWVSLSKTVQYLAPQEEQMEKRQFRKRARNWKKKSAILTTYYRCVPSVVVAMVMHWPLPPSPSPSSTEANPESSTDDGGSKGPVRDDGGKGTSHAKKKTKKNKVKSKTAKKLSEARLKSYGL